MPTANITIKKKTGSSEYTELYPTTVISQVTGLQSALDDKVNTSTKGQANGVASLDSDAKIPANQLPNIVFDGLSFLGTSGTVGSTNLRDYAAAAYTASLYANQGRGPRGFYFVASTSFLLAPNNVAVLVGDKWFSTRATPGDGNVSFPSDAALQVLEAGDWFVVAEVTGEGTEASPFDYRFAIVNNTYELAQVNADGIVRLSSSGSTATTGNNVVTDGILKGLLATANTSLSGTTNTNKLAPAAHHHDSLYLGINSNATSASQWATARTVTFATGTVTGSFSIDGSADVSNVALTYTGNEFYYTEGDAAVGDLVFETDPS